MAKTDQKTGESLGTGRRKSSVARVRVKTGSGTIVINGKPLNEYFPVAQDQRAIIDTLNALSILTKRISPHYAMVDS